MNRQTYNTADALLDALQESGVSYLFSNLGSDHPAIIEALAKAKAAGRQLPEVIICPHEYVALSAAHGYYLLSQEAQGVFVHTDVGTQNLGGSVHNASRSRIPVFIFSGETPVTLHGELPGSRNTHINYLQNVYDQRGIVREYVKWEYDIRTGQNVKELVYRAMQIAKSEPQGPVYLTGGREVLEEDVRQQNDRSDFYRPISASELPAEATEQIAISLAKADKPVIMTSYAGRNTGAVSALIQLSERWSIPVIESNASYMNFPWDHPMHAGFLGGNFLTEADIILVIDADVPWIPNVQKPADNCQIYVIDRDPLKRDMPLWNIPAHASFQVDTEKALYQLINCLERMEFDQNVLRDRRERVQRIHKQQREEWNQQEIEPEDGVITPEWLTVSLRQVVNEDTVILQENITNAMAVHRHLPRNKPGTMFVNGGSSLGWSLGASLGVKLSSPEKTVVNLIGDGSFLFGIPSSVFWMSRKYKLPFLTVIYNNRGWNATKQNVLKMYPEGISSREDLFWVNFDQPADLAGIAEAAGGALGIAVTSADQVNSALSLALEAVQSGRSAVVDARLANISNQT